MTAQTVLLAGGGTGGHIYPLLAVAAALESRVARFQAVFVGTDRGLESRLVPPTGIELELMPSVPFRGGGVRGGLTGLWGVARCLAPAMAIVKKHRPSVVLSSGGYAAVPIALAARAMGVPLLILEPNGSPGLANRLTGPLARRVYTVFETTGAHFRSGQVLRAGHALRSGFERQPYVLEDGHSRPLRLLVLGGSQGAVALNRNIPEALAALKRPVEVVHQVGLANRETAEKSYRSVTGHSVQLVDFIDDMPAALAQADLVLARAGTGHIAETCAVGRPSILLPLASTGVGQLQNAQAVEMAGAAVCIAASEASPENIAAVLNMLDGDRDRMRTMAERAGQWGSPHAADRIAEDLMTVCKLQVANARRDEVAG